MVISNIGGFDYSSIGSFRREIPQISEEELQSQINKENLGALSAETQEAAAEETSAEEPRQQLMATRDASIFALDSELKTDRFLIGSEMDLAHLDISKAISDIKKDSLVSEYTYFVGNINTEDGSVTRKQA